jgi:hypothetical protein
MEDKMAKLKATQEHVSKAADELVLAGKEATALAVREITGGSYSTVGKALKAWEDEQARLTFSSIVLPDTLTRQGNRFVNDLWQTCQQIAQTEIAQIRALVTQEKRDSEVRMHELLAELDRMQMLQTDQEAELSRKEQQLQDAILLNARYVALEEDRQRLLVEQVTIREQLVRLTVVNEGLRKEKASAENEASI